MRKRKLASAAAGGGPTEFICDEDALCNIRDVLFAVALGIATLRFGPASGC